MSERIFEVTIVGQINDALRAQFDDVELDVELAVGHGVSSLRVTCRDAAALHGMLGRIETLGLELLDVRPVDSRETEGNHPLSGED